MAVVCFAPIAMGGTYSTRRRGTGLAAGRPRDLTHILADLVQATAKREQYNIGMAVLGSQMDVMHAARARVEADIERLQVEYSAEFQSLEAGHSLKNIVPVVEENAARAGLASRAAFLRQAAGGPGATEWMSCERRSGTGGAKTTAEVVAANAKVAATNARLVAANARVRQLKALARARKNAAVKAAAKAAEAPEAVEAVAVGVVEAAEKEAKADANADAKAGEKSASAAGDNARVVEAKNAGAGVANEASGTAEDDVGATNEAEACHLAVGEHVVAEEHKDADTEAASSDEEAGGTAVTVMAKEAHNALGRWNSSDDEDGVMELSPETEELVRAAHMMAEVVPVSMVVDVDFPITRTP
jgi:hypothetical protein